MVVKASIRTYSVDSDLVVRRRQQIAVAAARVLVKKAFDRTTVREIANACGMSPWTIYHYIGSKEDIIDLVLSHGEAHYKQSFEKADVYLKTLNPTQALKQAIEDFYRKLDRRQDFALFCYQEAKNMSPRQLGTLLDWDRSVVDVFRRLLDKGCASGEFVIDDVRLVANRIVSDSAMWAVRRCFLRKHCTLEEYIGQEIQFILRAISRDKGIYNEG